MAGEGLSKQTISSQFKYSSNQKNLIWNDRTDHKDFYLQKYKSGPQLYSFELVMAIIFCAKNFKQFIN